MHSQHGGIVHAFGARRSGQSALELKVTSGISQLYQLLVGLLQQGPARCSQRRIAANCSRIQWGEPMLCASVVSCPLITLAPCLSRQVARPMMSHNTAHSDAHQFVNSQPRPIIHDESLCSRFLFHRRWGKAIQPQLSRVMTNLRRDCPSADQTYPIREDQTDPGKERGKPKGSPEIEQTADKGDIV